MPRARLIPARVRSTRASHSYASVLLLVIISFLFTAVAPNTSWARGITVLIECATLVLALWTSRTGPLKFRVVIAVVASLVAAFQISTGDEAATTAGAAVSGLLVIGIAIVVGRGVVNEGIINVQSVIGAICIYLLVGMMFLFAYGVVAVADSAPFFAQGTDGTTALRLYFSFVTLTTVGYGDYTASTNLGHTLAIVEALFGQIYLVTVVTVLVSRMTPRRGPAAS